MNFFVFVAAAAMALTSCQKSEIENVKPQEYEYTFLIGNADTKATIGDNCVEWENGDQIGSFTKTDNGYSKVTVTEGLAQFSIYSSGGLAVNDVLHFYYPYNSGAGQDKTAVLLSFPVEQDGDDDMPMVSLPFTVTEASADTQTPYAGEIKFANLGAVIEFNIYTEAPEYESEIVKSVTFEADQNIAGDFTFDLTGVDYSNKDESLAVKSELTEKTVVATVSSNLSVGTEGNYAKVKMVVAPGNYSGNVVVKTNVATYTFPMTSPKTFRRSEIKPIGLKLRSDVRSENAQTIAIFDFTANEWGLPVSNTNDGNAGKITESIQSEDVQMTVPTHGSTPTRLWDSSGSVDLRAYSGSSLSFAVPSGYVITNMKFTGTASAISPKVGTYSDKTWSGIANPVVLNVTGTIKVETIEVEYTLGDVPSVVLQSIVVDKENAQTEYTVGDDFKKPTVTATYSDGTTADVKDAATFTGYNMEEAGTYTVTVTYEGQTDEYSITVSEESTGGGNTPTDPITISLDLSRNLFNLSTSKANDASSEISKTYEGYTYKFKASDSFYYYGSKAMLLGKKESYISFPAIPGYKLISVKASNCAGASSNASIVICSTSSTTAVSGGTASTITQGSSHTWTLSNTTDNTSYRFFITNAYAIQLTELVLSYSPVN